MRRRQAPGNCRFCGSKYLVRAQKEFGDRLRNVVFPGQTYTCSDCGQNTYVTRSWMRFILLVALVLMVGWFAIMTYQQRQASRLLAADTNHMLVSTVDEQANGATVPLGDSEEDQSAFVVGSDSAAQQPVQVSQTTTEQPQTIGGDPSSEADKEKARLEQTLQRLKTELEEASGKTQKLTMAHQQAAQSARSAAQRAAGNLKRAKAELAAVQSQKEQLDQQIAQANLKKNRADQNNQKSIDAAELELQLTRQAKAKLEQVLATLEADLEQTSEQTTKLAAQAQELAAQSALEVGSSEAENPQTSEATGTTPGAAPDPGTDDEIGIQDARQELTIALQQKREVELTLASLMAELKETAAKTDQLALDQEKSLESARVIEERTNQARIELKEVKAEKQKLDKQIERARTQKIEFEQSLAGLRTELGAVSEDASKLTGVKEQTAKTEEALQTARKELVNIKAEKDQLDKRIELARAQQTDLQATNQDRIAVADLALEQTKKEHTELEQSLAKLKKELAAAKEGASQLTGIKEQAATTEQVLQAAGEELAHTKKQKEQLDAQIEQAKAQQSELDKSNQDRIADADLALENVRKEHEALEQSLANLKNEVTAASEDASRLAGVEEQTGNVKRALENAQTELASSRAEKEDLDKQIEEAKARQAELDRDNQDQIAAAEQALDLVRNEKSELEATLLKLREELEMTKKDLLVAGVEQPDDPVASEEEQPAPATAFVGAFEQEYAEPLLDLDSSRLTVQISSKRTQAEAAALIDRLAKTSSMDQPFYSYLSNRQEIPWYPVLYGNFDTIDEAKQAILDMPKNVRIGKPFVRKVATIQKRMRDL